MDQDILITAVVNSIKSDLHIIRGETSWYVFMSKTHRWEEVGDSWFDHFICTRIADDIQSEENRLERNKNSVNIRTLYLMDSYSRGIAFCYVLQRRIKEVKFRNIIISKLKEILEGNDDIAKLDGSLQSCEYNRSNLWVCSNGVIDFRDILHYRFRDGLPGDYALKSCNMSYSRNDGKEMELVLQTTFTDSYTRHIFLITMFDIIKGKHRCSPVDICFYGAASSGKTTMQSILSKMFGEYHAKIPLSDTKRQDDSSVPTEPRVSCIYQNFNDLRLLTFTEQKFCSETEAQNTFNFLRSVRKRSGHYYSMLFIADTEEEVEIFKSNSSGEDTILIIPFTTKFSPIAGTNLRTLDTSLSDKLHELAESLLSLILRYKENRAHIL